MVALRKCSNNERLRDSIDGGTSRSNPSSSSLIVDDLELTKRTGSTNGQ